MSSFDSTEDVERDLEGLSRGDEPFVARLARRPGQKEERWAHLLGDESVATEPSQDSSGSRAVPFAAATGGSDDLRTDGLRDEVEALRKEVEALRADVDALKEARGL
ncbi:MAG TPA: hypothetical protein VFH56_04270 [Acidimicrobiales bacterium]|nr:hypothetical protein [Acidimicrobiales bacterium]